LTGIRGRADGKSPARVPPLRLVAHDDARDHLPNSKSQRQRPFILR
jgi:hypothetical protein